VLSTFEPSTGINLVIMSVEDRAQLKALGLPDKSTTAFVLQAGETLSFLGTVGLTLLQGEITLFGTTLYPSSTQHPIFAPRSHPIATVTASNNSSEHPLLSEATWLPKNLRDNVTLDHAILLLQDLDCGIEGMGRVCKTFANVFEIDSDYRGVDFGLAQFCPVSIFHTQFTRSSPQMDRFGKDRPICHPTHSRHHGLRP
jgi:polynucleotide 5'-hydroxyl-kinase GRC3/NOL9